MLWSFSNSHSYYSNRCLHSARVFCDGCAAATAGRLQPAASLRRALCRRTSATSRSEPLRVERQLREASALHYSVAPTHLLTSFNERAHELCNANYKIIEEHILCATRTRTINRVTRGCEKNICKCISSTGLMSHLSKTHWRKGCPLHCTNNALWQTCTKGAVHFYTVW